MRITNGIINNNTKSNILLNKEYSDKYNTMVATGQRITRPSDDPIIAIRALRLNNNISEIEQYHGKNIPDAEAWIDVTETALKQTEGVLADVQKQLVQGASDDNTAQNRRDILESLKGLRDQLYSSGNSDYAGRTVFTGYRTGEALTFMHDEVHLRTMVQNFTDKDFETINHISGTYEKDIKDLSEYDSDTDNQTNVRSSEVARLRLAYDNLTKDQKSVGEDGKPGDDLPRTFTITLKDGSTKDYPVTVSSFTPSKAYNEQLYLTVPDDGVMLITDTGELILGKNAAADMRKEDSTASFEYAKEDWRRNDPRPEHYYASKTYDDDAKRLIKYNYSEDGTRPDFVDQKINYEIAYNQKIEINVNADEVYKTSIARDVDELMEVTQNCLDAEEKLNKVKELEKDIDNYSYTDRKKILELKDTVQKEFDFYKEKMQKMFSHGLTIFKGYSEAVNNKIAEYGSLSARLELTKSRVGEQRDNFKELADKNINIELTESAIDLKNAELALEAAQQAAAKVAKVSLLNYL